jgi:NAD(P)H-flavin reductase
MSIFKALIEKLETVPTKMQILESEKIGSHIQKVVLAFPANLGLNFPIGSYIQPDVGAGVTRAYSVAEATDSTCTIIVSFSGKGMGARFFSQSPVGTFVDVYGPYSDFPYHYDTKHPKIFLATGTGIAPFVKMIPEAIKEKLPVLLALGVPREEDIPYKKYFDDLESNFSNFKTIYVLSNGSINWNGARGYITNQFSGEREKWLRNSNIYVCGVPPMVEGVLKLLKNAEVPKNQIFVQKFG